MQKTIGERLQETSEVLNQLNFEEHGKKLYETYKYSTSSSELYFKASGLIKTVLNDLEIKDELLIKRLEQLKADIDKNIS